MNKAEEKQMQGQLKEIFDRSVTITLRLVLSQPQPQNKPISMVTVIHFMSFDSLLH